MKEYVIPILEFLAPPKAVPRRKVFHTILEGAGEIKLNPIAETKLKEFLIYHRLIEVYRDPFETESIVLPKKYIISDHGKEVLRHIRYLKNLDSITYWLVDDYLLNGNAASYHSIEEICNIKKIEYSIHYDADMLASGLVEIAQSKDGNAYKLKPMAYKMRLRLNSSYHVNKYLDEVLTTSAKLTSDIEVFEKKPSPIIPHNITTTHNTYNIQDTKGNVFTGDKNRINELSTQEPTKSDPPKKSFWEKYGDTAKIVGGIGAIAALVLYLIKYFTS